jgi:hypothetical protein
MFRNLKKLKRALQDNSGATNSNTIRVMEQATRLDELSQQFRHHGSALERIARALEALLPVLNSLLALMQEEEDEEDEQEKPTEMHLQFEGSSPDMPGQEQDNQTIPCSAIETDADGNPVTLNPANVTWAIDDPTVAALTQNPDGSASFKALKVGGPTNISCTDNGVTPPLVGTNTLTVVASTKTATAMALVFGDPQASTT